MSGSGSRAFNVLQFLDDILHAHFMFIFSAFSLFENYYFITRKRRDIFIENLKHEGLTVGDGESGGMLDSF